MILLDKWQPKVDAFLHACLISGDFSLLRLFTTYPKRCTFFRKQGHTVAGAAGG